METSDANRRVVLCDASPLIFLAKLNRLELIEAVTSCRSVVLECVVHEVLSDRALPVEARRLQTWLAEVEVIRYEGGLFASDALSRVDRSSLAWAVENHVEWLLVDERLMRRFAREYGLKVIGFCGLLLQAVKQNRLSRREAQDLFDTSIREHGLRVSVELYQRVLDFLGLR